LQALDINKAITGCHSNQMGELVGGVQFATWEEAQALHAAGWEICCHNREDDDYSHVEFADSVETNFELANTEQEAQSLPCNNYIGNKYSALNKSSGYYASKIGWGCVFSWGTVGGVTHGTNPQAINPYLLCSIATDISSGDGDPYYIDKASPTTEIANIKAQIDLCVSGNRWLVIMIHNYTANMATALTEVINYAKAADVEFVTAEEALENTSYQ
jgi:hypothetical protein